MYRPDLGGEAGGSGKCPLTRAGGLRPAECEQSHAWFWVARGAPETTRGAVSALPTFSLDGTYNSGGGCLNVRHKACVGQSPCHHRGSEIVRAPHEDTHGPSTLEPGDRSATQVLGGGQRLPHPGGRNQPEEWIRVWSVSCREHWAPGSRPHRPLTPQAGLGSGVR